ncbi:MAG: hypothetical protein Kow0069_27610 [Promethearchaeota archaeon]
MGIALAVASVVALAMFAWEARGARASLRAAAAADEIAIEEVRVPARDGAELAALVVYPSNLSEFSEGSLPLVVINHGINNRKERQLDKGVHFAKRGAVVVVIDARGHGESGGRATVGLLEPGDLWDVVDWAVARYGQVDPNRTGLLGMSLGALNVLIAQTTRSPSGIAPAAVVAYHPPVDLSLTIGAFGVEYLVGRFAGVDLTREGMALRSPKHYLAPNNTRNLLLLHGTGDRTVNWTQSLAAYEQVGGPSRDDVQLVLRPGLDHGENEGDPLSLGYATTWFDHYLRGEPLSLEGEVWAEAAAAVAAEVRELERPPLDALATLATTAAALAGCSALLLAPWGTLRRMDERAPVSTVSPADRRLGGLDSRVKWAIGTNLAFVAVLATLGFALRASLMAQLVNFVLLAGGTSLVAALVVRARNREKRDVGSVDGQAGEPTPVSTRLGALSSPRVGAAFVAVVGGSVVLQAVLYDLAVEATLRVGGANLLAPAFWEYVAAFSFVLTSGTLLYVDFGGLRVRAGPSRALLLDSLKVGVGAAAFHSSWVLAATAWWGGTSILGLPLPANLALALLVAAVGFALGFLLTLLSGPLRNASAVPVAASFVLASLLTFRFLRVV